MNKNQQFKWLKSRPVKGMAFPASREGASLIYVKRYNYVVLFGGIANGRLNDIMIFDIDKDEWRQQLTQGRQPSPRCYHCGFYDDISNNLFYYGGQGDKARSMSDFYVLNCETWVWKRLFMLEFPANRHNCSISPNGHQEKIIFGGACLPEDLLYNDVWLFNYSGVQYTSSAEIPGGVCTKKATKGEVPSARQGHGAVNRLGQLFIFGGRGTEDMNIYSLKLDIWVWRKVPHLGKIPSPRAFFTANLIDSNVIIFGGYDPTNKALNDTYVLDLNEMHWSAPFTAGQMPSARAQHSSCLIEDILLVLGGLSQTYCAMDMYFLSQGPVVDQGEWEQIKQPSADQLEASEAASSMIMETKMYLNEVEDAIARERLRQAEIQKDLQVLQQSVSTQDDFIDKKTLATRQEHAQAKDLAKNSSQQIEAIFIMIKQEQILSKQIQWKIKLLEDSIQQQSSLMVGLDQFAISIRKIQGIDAKDVRIKKISEQSASDIQKMKDGRLDGILNLQKTYKNHDILSRINEVDIVKYRNKVKDLNTDFEQLIFETEQD